MKKSYEVELSFNHFIGPSSGKALGPCCLPLTIKRDMTSIHSELFRRENIIYNDIMMAHEKPAYLALISLTMVQPHR